MTISAIRTVELDAIKSDTEFYFDLVLPLIAHRSSGILIFGLVPYLSLFTVETYKYFQEVMPSYAKILFVKHRTVIEASRLRVKLFDDTEKGINGVFELLNWILEFNNEWHINQYKGILAPLKRMLQCDLGIYTYDDHVIGSTHTGLLNLGLKKGDLPTSSKEISAVFGPLEKSVAEGMGSYLGQLCSSPEFAPSSSGETHYEYTIQDKKLGFEDMKSQRFFAAIFNGNGSVEINFSLLLFLTTVNYFRYVLTNLVSGSSYSMFKLKFTTLYHLASSLEKLHNYYYPKNQLSDRSKQYFRATLTDKDLDLIRRQRKFRNILVHYALEGVPEGILDLSTRMYGLTEYFFDGITFNELDSKLDNQIARMSDVLEEWLNWQFISRQF
ncbi:MAG: hypothetical protein A2W35_08770 [Chloroflexi bacterium RBG_16_57_11]|nr:MAG: hypothetical protein A2W35_08770 [Chloroflexi bacterium RBG_16_57_11]